MYPGFLKMIKDAGLMPEVEWKVGVDSSVVKMRKPNEDIYLLAQKEVGVEGKEILFIDNTRENLIVPEKLGWQTFWYNSGDYAQSNEELATFLG